MNNDLPPILIVDDEKNMRISLETVMKDEGYETIAAESAEEGLEMLKTEPCFLVIITYIAKNTLKHGDDIVCVHYVGGGGNINNKKT